MDLNCKSVLREVIELQIVPRLMGSHFGSNSSTVQKFGVEFSPDSREIAAFARMCISGHPAMSHVEQWVQQGHTLDDICLKLIAPVARHLGWMWEQDEADFAQVSLGLTCLQQITHQLGYSNNRGPQCSGVVRRMMICSAPGSQHLLGLAIVAELFRGDGWDVVVEIGGTQSALLEVVRSEWIDLVGLSVGVSEQLPLLPDLIGQLKFASRNANVSVILGGTAFLGSDLQAHQLGADGISLDAADAVMLGNLLVEPPVPSQNSAMPTFPLPRTSIKYSHATFRGVSAFTERDKPHLFEFPPRANSAK
jgi:methanogenic corrinoid protein MtbC1